MISVSRYWKTPLLRAATWLQRLRVEEETSEKSLMRVEREIFIGFYAIRKLISTFKLSISTKQISVTLESFPAIQGEIVDYFNRHNFEELFDLDSVTQEQHDLEFLCNQVIHSYVFIIGLTEDGIIEGFYLTSDKMRHKKLYFVPLAQVISVFRAVGQDYPKKINLQREPQTDEWRDMQE